MLLLASLAFYTWGTGALVIPLIVSIAANYELGRRIEAAIAGDRQGMARLVLAIAIVMNVALLASFKYANFFVHSVVASVAPQGATSAWRDIILPIGISFYTFHSLSYLVDIRGPVQPPRARGRAAAVRHDCLRARRTVRVLHGRRVGPRERHRRRTEEMTPSGARSSVRGTIVAINTALAVQPAIPSQMAAG